MRANNLVFILLVGIPCSGKSTWIKENSKRLSEEYSAPVIVISKDHIRASMSPTGKQWYKKEFEDEVTRRFYKRLSEVVSMKNTVVVVDNTNVKPGRLKGYLTMFKSMMDNGQIQLYIKFFDISLWLARTRNFFRKLKEDKHVPARAMVNYFNNYKAIKQEEYKNYLLPL